jgi:hypothetical protein
LVVSPTIISGSPCVDRGYVAGVHVGFKVWKKAYVKNS